MNAKSQSTTGYNFGFVMTILAFLFFLEAARELLGATYNMNLATMSLNSSVVAIFAFFSPVLYLVGVSRFDHRVLVVTSGIILAVSRVLMGVNPPVTMYLLFAVIAVAAFGIFLPALLVYRTGVLGFVCAATLGAGADVMFRALGDTFDITVYGVTAQRLTALVVVVPLVLCFLIALFYTAKTTKTANKTSNSNLKPLLGFGIGAVGFLYFAVLGYPNNVARWVDGSYTLAAVLIGAALGGFVLMVHTRARAWLTSDTGFYTGSIILLLTVIVLVISHPLAVVLCGLCVFFLPVLFLHTVQYLMRPHVTVKQIAAFLTTAGVTFVILALLSVFSLTYAYVPGMSVLRNQIGTIIMAAVFLALLGTAAVWYKSSPDFNVIHNRILASVLSVIIICGTVSGVAIYQATPVQESKDSLTVMTYNIHQGYNTDGKINPWQILEPINRVNPDILALQESDMNRITSTNTDIVQWLAHKLDMYVYFGPETKNQIYGVAILSKFPLYNQETYYLTSIDDQRVLVRADIQWNDTQISLYAVHMGLSEEERTNQTAEILEILSKNQNPKILMGDLNSVPGSEQIRAYTAVLTDAWTSSGYSSTDPLGCTSDSLEPQKRIDYILMTPVFSARTCEVIRCYGSDHLPVWAELVHKQ